MFTPLAVGSPNYPERLARRDGATLTLHRHAAPAPEVPPWEPLAGGPRAPSPVAALDERFAPRTISLTRLPHGGDAVVSRTALLTSAAVTLRWISADSDAEPVTFTCLDGDQLVCVVEGGAALETPCGTLRANPAEHVFVPRALPHRWRVDKLGLRALVMEFAGELRAPPGHRNAAGQPTDQAPFGHHDLHRPNWFARPHIAAPERAVLRRHGALWTRRHTVDPVATVGWEGAVYPVSLAWEAPLAGRRAAELFATERSIVRTRIVAHDEPTGADGDELVTLSVDGDGEARLVWEPVDASPARGGAPGVLAVQVRARDPFALAASGALALADAVAPPDVEG